MPDSSFVVKNTLSVNGAFTANSTSLAFGNTTISPNGYISAASGATLTFTGSVSTAQANIIAQTLTDAATIDWNVANGQIAYLTLGGNRTINAPSNIKVGTYILHVNQDSTGSRTLTWNAIYKWTAGVAPVLSTSANRKDIFTFMSDGTYMYGSYLPDVR